MSIGTCKGFLIGASLLGLTACEDFVGLNVASAPSDENLALRTANLGNGAVTLVPPAGFCIDRRSLDTSFAIMARCDTLGGNVTTDAPLALITATAVAVDGTAQISASNVQGASETVLQRDDSGPLTLVQVKGTPPGTDIRDTYWRGAGQVGNHVIGLAIYEGAQTGNLGSAAPILLAQTFEGTRRKSATDVTAVQDNSATRPTKPARGGFLSGLFE